MNTRIPEIGQWYRAIEFKNIFEVVAFDDDSHNIEIQYYDGEIEELDPDLWNSLHVKAIEQPKDWTAPFEMNREDTEDYIEEVHQPNSFENQSAYTHFLDNE